MVDIFLDNPPAAAFGLFGMLCLIGWPLFRSRRAMLLVQLGIGLGLGGHYALLGAYTGALMNALSALQVLAAIPIDRRPGLRWLYLSIVPAIAIVSVATWSGWPSACAALGMTMLTLGRFQSDPTRMRIVLLAAVPFWLAHDVLIGSLPAITADIATMAIGGLALMRGLPSLAAPRSPGLSRLRQNGTGRLSAGAPCP